MDYMRDMLCAQGTDMDTLKKWCDRIDRNTVVKRLDYSDCMILHYLQGGRSDPKIYCLAIYPGMQTKTEELYGVPHVVLPEPRTLSVPKMKRAGVADMIEDLQENQTIFMFANNTGADFVFTSRAVRKTMGVRLPLTDQNPSVERDLLLAKKIGDTDAPLEFYTVLRSAGSYHLAIGMFAREPKRASWSETTEFALHSGTITYSNWKLSQKDGLSLEIRYKEEAEAIRSSYPGCKYVPFHVFSVCDSGRISDGITGGWMDPEDSDVRIYTETYKANESWDAAMEKSIAAHVKEAEMFQSVKADMIFSNEDRWIRHFLSSADTCGMETSIGIKPMKKFLQYAVSRYHAGVTGKEAREVVMDAMKDGVFSGFSDYADRIMRERTAWKFIQAV